MFYLSIFFVLGLNFELLHFCCKSNVLVARSALCFIGHCKGALSLASPFSPPALRRFVLTGACLLAMPALEGRFNYTANVK